MRSANTTSPKRHSPPWGLPAHWAASPHGHCHIYNRRVARAGGRGRPADPEGDENRTSAEQSRCRNNAHHSDGTRNGQPGLRGCPSRSAVHGHCHPRTGPGQLRGRVRRDPHVSAHPRRIPSLFSFSFIQNALTTTRLATALNGHTVARHTTPGPTDPSIGTNDPIPWGTDRRSSLEDPLALGI